MGRTVKASLAESASVAAWREVKVKMSVVVGITAGAQHGGERSTGLFAYLVEKPCMLLLRLWFHIYARPIAQGEPGNVQRIAVGVLGNFRGIMTRPAHESGNLLHRLQVRSEQIGRAHV